MKIKEQTR